MTGPARDNILQPETEQLLYEKTLLPIIAAGESTCVRWVAHGGKRKAMQYFSQNAAKFGFDKLGKYLLAFVDKNELTEESAYNYFNLMLRSMDAALGNETERPSTEDAFYRLKTTCEKLLKQGYHLVFIFDQFDGIAFQSTFFENLHSLWQMNKPKVHFLFACSKDVLQPEVFNQYGSLREVVAQNMIYFPLFSANDNEFVAQYFCDKYGYSAQQEVKNLAVKMAGGHPALLKSLLRIISRDPALARSPQVIDLLLKQWEIKIMLEDIFKGLSPEEQTAILRLAHEKTINQNLIPDSLTKLRLVINQGQTMTLFSPLFIAYLKTVEMTPKTLTVDKQNGQILVGGEPAKEKITLQEYHLLSLFAEKPGLILSRDTIADTLWGKESFEKYSDWSIDQIISQLRKKLEMLGISSRSLQTVRGRGYRWLE